MMRKLHVHLLGRLLITMALVYTVSVSTLGGVSEVGASVSSPEAQTKDDVQVIAAAKNKTYNDTDSAWVYSGHWSKDKARRAVGGQIHTSNEIEDHATISITGARFTLVYSTAPNYGELDVFVDDLRIATINQQKSKTSHQKEWDSPEFTLGTHVIKFVHANGKMVNIDAIKVRGPKMNPGLPPTSIPTILETPTLLPSELPNPTGSPLPTETPVVPISPTDLIPVESPTSTSLPEATSSPTLEVVFQSSTSTPSLDPGLDAGPTSTPAHTATPSPTATYAFLPNSTATSTPVVILSVPSPTTTVTNTEIPPTATPTVPGSTSGQVWFVDNLATGNNTGTSWQNAWKSFTDVNFNAIGSGDTLYISGGITSKTYTGTIRIPPGTTSIIITTGVDSGHDGEVILDGGNSTQYGVSINAEGTPVKNLIISNLTFRNYTGAGVYGSGQNSGGLQGITVDNCKFLNFNRAGVFFEGNNNLSNNYNVVVRNSYFDDNDSRTSQSDGIYVQVLKDFTADHNYIILDNNYTGVADLHSDNIQTFWVDNVMYSNNVVVQKSNKTLGTQMLFTENGYGEHVFLNNVFIRDTPYAEDSAMRLKSANGPMFTAKVIGNTYYGKGRILNSSTVTTIKNNIFYGISQPTSDRPIYITSSGSVISNNIFYDPSNQFPSAWGGLDVNPMFLSTDFDTIDLHLQPNSPAINAGANLGSQYMMDIEGKLRGLVWDSGAYESSNP